MFILLSMPTRRFAPSPQTLRRVFALLLLLTVGPLGLAEGSEDAEACRARLLEKHPEARVVRDAVGRARVTDAGMSAAPTPDRAVSAWIHDYAPLLFCEPEGLELLFAAPLGSSPGEVFGYRPLCRGYPVEGGAVRIVVVPREGVAGTEWVVTYAASATAATMELPDRILSADLVVNSARQILPGSRWEWGEPELRVRPGGPAAPKGELRWAIPASDREGSESWWVDVDPRTGVVLELKRANPHLDVSGEVQAMISPSPRPDIPSNPPQSRALAGVHLEFDGGAAATTTTAAGSFQLTIPGSTSPTVELALRGDWAEVQNMAGPDFVWTGTVTPGQGPLILDAQGDELVQAQLNAFFFTHECHEFFRDRTAAIPGLDQSLLCRVNLNGSCNASYDPIQVRMNFFRSGGGCANASFSSVVAHEYGHFVVHQLGLQQGAFGEGFGDSLSMMLLDHPIIGLDFEGPGTVVRDPVAAEVDSPCFGSIHYCGQTLASIWWRIRDSLGDLYSPEVALEIARQMFVDWALITVGAPGTSSANEQTAVEILTIDDDDGDLANGSPHYFAICEAFDAHDIDCPPAPEVLFVFPSGRPEVLAAGAGTAIEVRIESANVSLEFSTARLIWRLPGGAEEEVVPVPSGGNLIFDLPAFPCGEVIEYYFVVEDDSGDPFFGPALGAAQPFRVTAYAELVTEVVDSFESDGGWSFDASSSTASSGAWERVVPIGTAAAPSTDHSPAGDQCWVTGQGTPGGGLGENDIDGGTSILRSPVFDLSLPGRYEVSYWRWFSNHAGANPGMDVLRIEVSFDGGTSWEELETVGPTGPESEGGWFTRSWVLNADGPPPGPTSFQIVASDLSPGSLVEAAFDDFEIRRWACTPEPEFIRGDANLDLSVGLVDAILSLEYLFLGGAVPCVASVDYNGDGQVAILDAIEILTAVFFGPAPFLVCVAEGEGSTLTCLGDPPCAP